ncbi:MAG: MGMT family protein [candidate division KSB1 bacterium]|nr:MGMT family protein [candidate division KSB1 bacterium]MDZ7274831.1 MGMT family protein [candidate division KSB1 bacterium]MDZ7288198.1 MGMT family protein [candidate division KSB1 bacterium]MDZ7300421.1 MGMT family protein [candidate division KSB1 bacterium]MDZ7308124.1 MGMT family protein [candidate division KSB1 bacterium]
MPKSGPVSFTARVKQRLRKIPRGKVATYGQIAALAGRPRAARQVAWILHSSAEKERLPWHRVINRFGRIALPHLQGYERQRELLRREGVAFGRGEVIDLERFQWRPRPVRPRR